jgi:hypothetical protein
MLALAVASLGACGATETDLSRSDEALEFSGCLEITSPGSYSLDGDIVDAPSNCVNIHDTSNVTLDCGGHQVRGTGGDQTVDVERVSNLTLASCTVSHGAGPWAVALDHVQGASIHDNDLDGVEVHASSGLSVTNNHVRVFWSQYSTTGTVVQGNTFDNPAEVDSAALFLTLDGSDNQVTGNHLDGSWGGDPADIDVRSTDDAILIGDEQRDVVDSNTIVNTWDCGIETLGTITDSRFTNNTIGNTRTASIGAFYYSSWLRNVVQGNTATAADYLFEIHADSGLRAIDTTSSFRDNTFVGNSAQMPSQFSFWFTRTGPPYGGEVRNLNPGDYRVGNNLFANNDEGANPIFTLPWFALVDGGGNSCGSFSDQTAPLECSRPAAGPQVFDDVPPSDPSFFLIADMAAAGITHGCTPSRFCVSDLVQRDQVAAFIIRALYGESFSYTTTPYFTDVPAGDPFFPYVQKMTDLGITHGCTPTKYCRADSVSRGELAVFLVRMDQLRGATLPAVPDTTYFTDVPPSHSFYSFVQIIRELAVMPGCTVDSFCPDQAMTRGQVASGLMRMLRTGLTP